MKSAVVWRGDVRVDDLQPYFMNSNVGDVDGIAGSLDEHGQYRSIVVNKGSHTGRTNEVLCGNNTLEAARKRGDETIYVEVVDVDDRVANEINLWDNKSRDRAHYDTDKLIEQLSMLDGDYDHTGWTEDEVEKLLTPPEPPDDDDTGPGMGDLEYRIVIDCRSEEHQEQLLRKFDEEGLTARPLIS